MTSWRESMVSMYRTWGAFALGAVLAFIATTAQAQDAPRTLKALLKAYQTMPGLEAEYVEHKHMALLAQPLESHGHIYFARPGYLLRKIDRPFPSTVVITDKELRMSDASGQKSIDLAARADVRPFVESLVWLLAGNAAALETAYKTEFESNSNNADWLLVLTPKGPPLSRIIARMEIHGSGLQVKTIEVHETSGDKSVMTIVSANPHKTFSNQERAKLFGIAKQDAP